MKLAPINCTNDMLAVCLLPLEILKPHEEYCENNYAYWMEQIINNGYWTKPILVEEKTKIIMDGHHRYQIACALKLRQIPCILSSYNNPNLSVTSFKSGLLMDSNIIINAGLSGKLLGKKSTRHELVTELATVNIPLSMLQ